MTLAHPDARSWALARSASDQPRLGMLEAVACQSHPEVVATFGEDGASVARLLERGGTGRRRRGLAAVGIILVLLGVIAPVVGMAVLGSGTYLFDRIPASESVPVAVFSFTVAVVMLVITGIFWLRDGAHWSGMICGYGVVAAICGLLATISMPTVSAKDGYPLTVLMQVPVWGTLALGTLLAVLVALRFRRREPEEAAPARVPNARNAAMAAAHSIPADERQAIVADRDAALEILAERGLIDDETLQRALAAPLGMLFTFDVTGRTAS
jgi:hypothetical protein